MMISLPLPDEQVPLLVVIADVSRGGQLAVLEYPELKANFERPVPDSSENIRKVVDALRQHAQLLEMRMRPQ